MAIDLSDCEIRTPADPAELGQLYGMLAEVFPIEKKLFQELIDGKRKLYNWEPHTLYHGNEPVGNVSLVAFELHDGGSLRKTAGIASVATPEKYRGMGIAKHLMKHVLKIVDTQNLPSILFTSLPRVYEGLGYQVVDQGVKQITAKTLDNLSGSPSTHDVKRTDQTVNMPGNAKRLLGLKKVRKILNPTNLEPNDGFTIQSLTHLNRKDLETAEKLYTRLLPFDGKLFRDREYWTRYVNASNSSGKIEFAFCRHGDKTVGYARLEHESDRILLNEFYAPSESREINSSLWNWACGAADKKCKSLISIALPSAHGLWDVLKYNGMAVEPESGAEREVFMVRMPKRGQIKWLPSLRWSLSDKF